MMRQILALRAWAQTARVSVAAAAAVAAFLLFAGVMAGRALVGERFRELAVESENQRALIAQQQENTAELNRQLVASRADLRSADARADALQDVLAQSEATRAELLRETAFYRQIFEKQGEGDEVLVRVLELIPDFRDGDYRLHAVLLRGGNARKPFKGAFRFDVVTENEDGARQIFQLSQETPALEFLLYGEIDERFSVAAGSTIADVRLAIFDENGKQVAERVLLGGEIPAEAESEEEGAGEEKGG